MRRKLTQRMTLVFLAPLVVLVAVQGYSISASQQRQQEEREAYYANVTRSAANSLELILDNIFKSATTFSYSPMVRQYLAADAGSTERAGLRDYVYELAMFSRKYNPELTELMLSNANGVESLVGYYSRELYDFVSARTQDPAAPDRGVHRYYFLNVEAQSAISTYVVFIMPVFNVRSGGVMGHVSVVCTVKNIRRALDVGEDVAIRLRDAETGETLLNSRERDNVGGEPAGPVTRLRPLAGEGLELEFLFDPPQAGGLFYGNASLLVWFVLVALFLLYGLVATHLVVVRPIQQLNRRIARVKNVYPNAKLDVVRPDEIGSIAVHINQMLDEIGQLNRDILETEINLYEAELEKNKSQLTAFQSQVNPHFLFNTLQCIRSKALLADMDEIAVMCGNVSRILRYGLSPIEMVPLQEELSITRRYLEVIKARHEDKITYEIEVEDEACLRFAIPKMVLQPLVENAVYHGLEPLPGPGKIRVQVRCGGLLEISVADNGVGFAPERLDEIAARLKSDKLERYFLEQDKENIGLVNVHQRIRLLYGSGYGLSVAQQPGCTVVSIRLPERYL